MDFSQIESDVIAYLTTVTGVTTWDSIQFSLLPQDESLGYIQLVEVPVKMNASSATVKYMVMVGFAAESLEDIKSLTYTVASNIFTNLTKPTVCFGSGQLSLDNPGVVIDIPDSDTTQNNITNTSLFRTALAFTLLVQITRP